MILQLLVTTVGGGHVYRYFGLPYSSPTIGCYFYAEDYIKFCKNLKYYIECDLKFISFLDSRYKEDLILHNNTNCPIGKLDDIEVVFLHYRSENEAREKWNRRKQRINWDNIAIKMSEQNLCNEMILHEFDKLPYKKKIAFVAKNYNIDSQIIWGKNGIKNGQVSIDTVDFKKYINIVKWLNGKNEYKKRQKR